MEIKMHDFALKSVSVPGCVTGWEGQVGVCSAVPGA